MYLGSYGINDYLPIPAATHKFSTGAAFAPTVLTYSIYEEANTTGIDEDVDMVVGTPFDAIVGCYYVRRQLTAAAGFEAGKTYVVVVKATVDGVSAIAMHTFQIGAKVDLVSILGTALTETAGQIAAAFKKFFNVAAPTGTVNSIPDAVPGAANGVFIAGTNATTTITNALTTTFTGNLSGTIGGMTAAALKDFFDTSSTTNYAAAVAGSVVKEIADNAGGSALTEAGIADAVWNEARADHVAVGSFGEGIGLLLTRITSTIFSGITYMKNWLAELAGKSVDAVTLAEINATTAGATYDNTTDSLEALSYTLAASGVTTTAAIVGDALNVTIGATYEATVTGLTISATWARCYFTVKHAIEADADTASVLQVRVSNPGVGTDGLLYLNGAAGTVGLATLVVTQAAGTVAIKILDEATDDLTECDGLDWDLKILEADGDSQIIGTGTCNINWTPTRAVV